MPFNIHIRLRALTGALVLMLVAGAVATPAGFAQEDADDDKTEAAPPAADPADVETIDAIVVALYDVISGPAGPRDWDRFRSLFAPGAMLAPTSTGQDGTQQLRVLSIEDYVTGAGGFFNANPFFEIETYREQQQFGNVVSLMSGYSSRRDPADEEPFQRGINAFTLLNDGTRWYVLSIAWDTDCEGNPIPEAYKQ